MPIHHYMTSILISSLSLTYYHMKIIRNLILSRCSLCSFAVFFTYQKSFDVFFFCFFFNAFLEENKGVHKLAARTAIRQPLWLEKNNYPEAGLLWASSTTQLQVKRKGKRGNADNKKRKRKKKHISLTTRDITEHNYQLRTTHCFFHSLLWLWLY